MKKNCVYKYITREQPQKDILIYEYGNTQEYIIHHDGDSCYSTYTKDGTRIKDINLLKLIWQNTIILCEYIDGDIIQLQVNFNLSK